MLVGLAFNTKTLAGWLVVGFNGDDHALTAAQLADDVASGEARYVQVGASFPGRGGGTL